MLEVFSLKTKRSGDSRKLIPFTVPEISSVLDLILHYLANLGKLVNNMCH